MFDITQYKLELATLATLDKDWYEFIINIVTNGADICRSDLLPSSCSDYCAILDPELILKITKKLNYHMQQGHLADLFQTMNYHIQR